MASWADAVAAAPDLAAKVRARFEATGLSYMGTLRRDGSPRISGVEPLFWEDDVWLGMMPDSRKTKDIARDGRITLHAANIDKMVKDGDARMSGRAELVTDQTVFEAYRAAFADANDEVPPGPFPLYKVDITELMHVMPAGDHLLIEWWHPGSEPESVKRY